MTRQDIIETELLVERLRFELNAKLDDLAVSVRRGNLATIGNASEDASLPAARLVARLSQMSLTCAALIEREDARQGEAA